jgi:hypothetical protein
MLVQEVPVPPHHRRWRSDPHRGFRDRPIREDLSSLERLDYRLSTLRVETGPPGELVLPLLLRAAGAACAPQARPGDAQRSGSVIVVSHAALRTICWEVGRSRWCGRMRMRDLGAGGAPVACVEKGVEHAASAISGPDCSRPSHPRHRALVATAAGAGLRWARRLASAPMRLTCPAPASSSSEPSSRSAEHLVKLYPKAAAGRRTVPLPPWRVIQAL